MNHGTTTAERLRRTTIRSWSRYAMSQRRTPMLLGHKLSALSLIALSTLACGESPASEDPLQDRSLSAASGSTDPQSDSAADRTDPSSYGCHPSSGMPGLTRIDMTAYPYYYQRETWCSVGTALPVGCYFGRKVVFQTIKSSSCAVPIAGSCYASDSIWEVTCNTWVECRYNCDGNCIPTIC